MVVHVSRLSDGSRKMMRISEISGMEGEIIMMQDLFEFNRTGVGRMARCRALPLDWNPIDVRPSDRAARLSDSTYAAAAVEVK